AREKCLDFGFNGVIDADWNRRAARGRDQVHGVFDGFRPAIRRRIAADAAAGAVDGRARLAECAGDAASGAARRSGDERDSSGEWSGHHKTTSLTVPQWLLRPAPCSRTSES